MKRTDFEPILSALLDALADRIEGLRRIDRRLVSWTAVEDQPALFLRLIGSSDSFSGTGLNRTTLRAEIWLYVKPSGDDAVAPGVELNDWIGRVRDAFAPDNRDTGEFTIGGKVQWARIEGDSDFSPGDTGQQSIAVFPVRILIP